MFIYLCVIRKHISISPLLVMTTVMPTGSKATGPTELKDLMAAERGSHKKKPPILTWLHEVT